MGRFPYDIDMLWYYDGCETNAISINIQVQRIDAIAVLPIVNKAMICIYFFLHGFRFLRLPPLNKNGTTQKSFCSPVVQSSSRAVNYLLYNLMNLLQGPRVRQ